jgi:hypothetical protein
MLGRQMAAAVLSGMILVAATSASLACKGSTVLFKDDFSKVNRAWQSAFRGTSPFSIADGKMLLRSEANKIAVVLNEGAFFNDADFCADIVMPQVDDASGKSAGVLLQAGPWYIGYITLDGQAGVSELTNDGWLNPIPSAPFDAVKTDPGAANTLRLVWKATDPTVTFYVNDKKVDSFDVPPSRGRKIGFEVESGGAAITYQNVVVTKP